MEPAMEPETLEARISECPGGARAGPEPEPGARGWPLSRRGRGPCAPSSRPAPDPEGRRPSSPLGPRQLRSLALTGRRPPTG